MVRCQVSGGFHNFGHPVSHDTPQICMKSLKLTKKLRKRKRTKRQFLAVYDRTGHIMMMTDLEVHEKVAKHQILRKKCSFILFYLSKKHANTLKHLKAHLNISHHPVRFPFTISPRDSFAHSINQRIWWLCELVVVHDDIFDLFPDLWVSNVPKSSKINIGLVNKHAIHEAIHQVGNKMPFHCVTPNLVWRFVGAIQTWILPIKKNVNIPVHTKAKRSSNHWWINVILLMEDIPNNHLGYRKPCKEWDKQINYLSTSAGFPPLTVLDHAGQGAILALYSCHSNLFVPCADSQCSVLSGPHIHRVQNVRCLDSVAILQPFHSLHPMGV